MLILGTSVRNEGLYILEWITYYKLLGVDKIIIYSNDNDDGSDELLGTLDKHNYIEWRPRTLKANESPQKKAFAELTNELLTLLTPQNNNQDKGSHYLALLDCDEFLSIKDRNISTIKELLEHYSWPDGLSINWRHFGSSNQDKYKRESTIKRFTKCSGKGFRLDQQIKTITKLNANVFEKIGHHTPRPFDTSQAKVIYAEDSAQPQRVAKDILNGETTAVKADGSPIFHEFCQLNHYAIRSRQEYMQKQIRGNGFDSGNKNNYNEGYWRLRDKNEDLDKSLLVKHGETLEKMISGYEEDILKCHRRIVERFEESSSKLFSENLSDPNQKRDDSPQRPREQVLNTQAINKKDVDMIRTAALTLEETDIEKALKLMKIALKLRPSGQFIKGKIEEYEALIANH